MYTRHKDVTTGVRWRCTKRAQGCKGSIMTCESSEEVILSSKHDHPPSDSATNVAKTRIVMKEVALMSNEKPASVVTRAMHDLHEEEKTMMKSEDSLKRAIHKQRCLAYPPTPSSLRDLVITAPWMMTAGHVPEKFLFYDNGPDAEARLLIFATAPCLRLLSESLIWFMDGNFDQAPQGFLQLYAILVPLGECAVSVVYGFMTRKTQEAYEELLTAIVSECESLGLNPAPDVVMTDFEKGAMNAVQAVLGEDTRTKACFFHLCQSTWRKVQELGLTSLYKEDDSFRLFVGMLDGLAFLPVEDVADGMLLLSGFVPGQAAELFDYFDAYM